VERFNHTGGGGCHPITEHNHRVTTIVVVSKPWIVSSTGRSSEVGESIQVEVSSSLAGITQEISPVYPHNGSIRGHRGGVNVVTGMDAGPIHQGDCTSL